MVAFPGNCPTMGTPSWKEESTMALELRVYSDFV